MARNHPSTDRWRETVGRKLGVVLDFTPTRIGQTLHIPCARGHKVDFEIKKPMAPEAVTRKLLHEGWTLGNNLLCPKHAGGKRKANSACGTQAPPMKEDAVVTTETKAAKPKVPPGYGANVGPSATKIIEALSQFKELTIYEIADLVMMKPNTVQKNMVTLFAQGAVSRSLGEADHNNHRPYRYSLSTGPTIAPPAPKKETPMASTAAPPAAAPAISDEARNARRLATMMLEEHFDVTTGRFRDGWTDDKIAKETGAAVAFVTKRREEDFGPLKEPSEIEEERARLDDLEQRITAFENEAVLTVDGWRRDLTAHRQRLSALVAKNGW